MNTVLLVVILLLLIHLNYQIYKIVKEKLSVPQNTGYVGYSYATGPLPYDSGADLRDCGTQFSQPSQGSQDDSLYGMCGPLAWKQGNLPPQECFTPYKPTYVTL